MSWARAEKLDQRPSAMWASRDTLQYPRAQTRRAADSSASASRRILQRA